MMFAVTNNTGRRTTMARQIAVTLLVAMAVAIPLSGTGSAQVSAAEQTKGQGQAAGAATAANVPEATCPAGGQCFADVPSSNSFYEFVNRIYQQDLVTGYPCGGAGEPCDAENRPYYRPGAQVTRQQMAKFIDNARRLPEIHIEVSGGSAPIYARNNTGGAIAAYSTSGQALTAQSSSQVAIYAQTGEAAAVSGYSTGTTEASYGVYGDGHTGVRGVGDSSGVDGVSVDGTGVYGYSVNDIGVHGYSTHEQGVLGMANEGDGVHGSSASGRGVLGISTSGDGVYGASDTGIAVHGDSNGSGLAGKFEGNVDITGSCCNAASGSYRIDDPTDPANKYLYHSAVESADMLNVYRGHVILDTNGSATVQLPSYFEALNGDVDYQLTPVGAAMPNLHIAQEAQANSFRIAGGKPGLKVSWQVTGVRHDPYAQRHRVPTQQDKPADEQGTYLHPELYGHPESKGVSSGK